jgi:uncharacterized protein (TIRG00374 family)
MKWLLALVVALLLYLGLSLAFGLQGLGDSLARLPFWWWLLAPATVLTSHLVLFGRWQYYLNRLGFPLATRASAVIYASGLALIVAPARSGEALRGLWLKRRHGFPLQVGVGVTLAERLADLSGALLVLSWGLGGRILPAVLVGLVGVGAGAWLFTHPRALARLEHGLEHLPVLHRWEGLIRLLREALRSMGRLRQLMKPGPLLLGVGLSTVTWMLEAALLEGLFGAMGAGISLGQGAVIRTATGLGGVLSFLPAGLGTSEVTSIGLAVAFGASRPQALAVTLILRLVTVALPCLVGSLVLMRQKDFARSTIAPGAGIHGNHDNGADSRTAG